MPQPEKIILYGNGKLAELVLHLLADDPRFRVCAVAADAAYVDTDTFRGKSLVAFEEVTARFPPDRFGMVVTVGYARMRARLAMFERAKAAGYRLANVIGRGARVFPDLTMGENNIVFDTVYVGPGGHIGSHNVIRPQCYVGHDTVLCDHAFIAPGVTIGSGCRIGSLSFIGLGSTVVPGTTIADETLVGAASLVLRDTEPFGRYQGHPARRAGEHAANGIVLKES